MEDNAFYRFVEKIGSFNEDELKKCLDFIDKKLSELEKERSRISLEVEKLYRAKDLVNMILVYKSRVINNERKV